MSLEIRVDLSDFNRDMQRAPAQVAEAFEAGMDRAGDVALHEKVKQVNKTYARPEGRDPRTGRQLWKRTGAWLGGQVVRTIGRFTRSVETTGPANAPITNYPEGYEEKVGVLPRSRDGVDRRNAAAQNARPFIERLAPRAAENEVEGKLRAAGLTR